MTKKKFGFLLRNLKAFFCKFPMLRVPFVWLFGGVFLRFCACSKNIKVKCSSGYLDFIEKSNKNTLRISRRHFPYALDIINSFEYYFNAVRPIKVLEFNLVDYSTPRYHDVIGYDRHPIFFPSFSEPLVTTNQYLSFADLKQNDVVLDLGAYSGLASIVFKDLVGPNGIVVAVDADEQNIDAINKNLVNYEKATNNKVQVLNGAVWNHDEGIEFSVEGNMGSSVVNIVGYARGLVKKVDSFKLSTIARKFNLEKVDFIKCDVEGAEAIIFEDEDFFTKFKPKIIVEIHVVENKETIDKVENDLKKFGYTFQRVCQLGVVLPLLECCYPSVSRGG